MALLQNVEATIHHKKQQALDLHFDGSDATKHAPNVTKNRSGQQWKEPAALIPTVGDGRQLKHACNELAKQD